MYSFHSYQFAKLYYLYIDLIKCSSMSVDTFCRFLYAAYTKNQRQDLIIDFRSEVKPLRDRYPILEHDSMIIEKEIPINSAPVSTQ